MSPLAWVTMRELRFRASAPPSCPGTNLLVAARVPGPKRALTDRHQAIRVQLAAFAAGLALALLAAVAGWRVGMAVAGVLPAALLIVVWRAVPRGRPWGPCGGGGGRRLGTGSSPADRRDGGAVSGWARPLSAPGASRESARDSGSLPQTCNAAVRPDADAGCGLILGGDPEHGA